MRKVVTRIRRPDPAVVERFRPLAFALVAEQLGRGQIMDPAIKPLLLREWTILGPAVTVQLDELDILMGMAAGDIAQSGDVIVVAAGGNRETAVWGGSMTRAAKLRACSGIVIDGMIQDTRSILEREIPVFCLGAHPAHAPAIGTGSVNVPVSCGGVVVHPGDVVMGNQDGVIVIPQDDLERVLAPAEASTSRLRASHADPVKSQQTFFAQRNGRAELERLGVVWEE